MIAPAAKYGDAASTVGLAVVRVDAASAVRAEFVAADVSDVLALAVVDMVAESAAGVVAAVVAVASATTTVRLCKIRTGLGWPAAEGTDYTVADADTNVVLCMQSQEVCPLPDAPGVCCLPMAAHRAACQTAGPVKGRGSSPVSGQVHFDRVNR
jgi:hypothetical protein